MKRGRRASLLEKLSQPILTFAGRHPEINLKIFEYLRDLREEQIKSANEFREASRRPSDNDLALHSVFLYDIYFADSFGILEKGLDKIYQSGSGFFLDREIANYKEFINTTAPSLTTIDAFINLPLLFDARERNLQPNGIRFGPMPGGIRYIQLRLSKTLPSFIILSAHIIFNNNIDGELNNHINGYFERKISLRSLRAKKFGYSASLVENEKAKAINDFITGYKTNVENLLKGYLRGLYLSSGQKCPSIEIYTISKLNISDDLVHRRSSDSDFWKTLKFEWPYQYLIFSSPPFTFFYDPHRELASSHKLLLEKDNIDLKYYGSIDGAVIMESHEFIAEYYKSFALMELLNYYLDKGKYLNIKMENIINKRLKGSFKHIIAVQQNVFKNSMRIEKIVNEYENLRARLPGYWKKYQHEMKDLKGNINLADFLLDSIDLKKNLLQSPYKLISSHGDRFLESKNIQINYALQKSLRTLSVILLIAAIIQILVALKIDFRVLFHKVAYALHNLF